MRQSEQRLQAVFETTPECMKVVAPDGTLLEVNSSGLRMLGATSLQDVAGKSVYELIAPEFRDEYRKFNERICRGEPDRWNST